MKNRDKKHVKRVRKMVIVCALCAIILTVSTYAWFIGMKTVNVSSFDVEIAAIDGLSLSLDGSRFSDTVSINQENYNDTENNVYVGNTNSWGGSGLIPISTVGIIDGDSSRMIMYEKGSLTTTPGGYRLMASQIENTNTDPEKDGYVAFDLFVKNLSGAEYYQELNQLNEEAIYLTIDSEVGVSSNGGEAGTGIENSVRVAFAQIGRVKADSAANLITGITCNAANVTTAPGYNANVTGICADRDAQIWEPNDTAHVQNAINWYNTACRKRTGTDVTLDASYDLTGATPEDKCGVVADGISYNTYAVSGVIDWSDNIDVYDGADYNKYTTSVSNTAADGKLVAYPYFTDTMKNLSGMDRPTFITLAPNSVTKIRIYVYIEGQDIDNYDFASLGKKITVKFGFTKERFFDEDISYDPTGTATLPDDVIKSQHVPQSGE